MKRYLDRIQAGKTLADQIEKAHPELKKNDDVLIYALPRGGVPVASEIAKALELPLDVFIVRKIGHPMNEEFAIGAVSALGGLILNSALLDHGAGSLDDLNPILSKAQNELARREALYRKNKPYPDLQKKMILLVDDGIATGMTIKAAIEGIRRCHVKKIFIAVPVCAIEAYHALKPLVDDFICPMIVEHLGAVGAFYDDFTQVSDDEVIHTLSTSAF
jgi:putative phosphoribosyl transferase